MAKLIYLAIQSLDGYIEDEDGIDWAEPDEEVNAFVNDLERSSKTHIGRAPARGCF